MTGFFMLDGRNVWWKAASEAAERWGYEPFRVKETAMGAPGDLGFVRPTAAPIGLRKHQQIYYDMARRGLRMVQDPTQIAVYDNKLMQKDLLAAYLPETRVFHSKYQAIAFLESHKGWPLVAKASIGASSRNVWVLRDAHEAYHHVQQMFGRGIVASHCADGKRSRQRGYVYFQRFIPHSVTWRVNAIGNGRAVFRRFNYSAARPVAQTGNVEPVMAMDDTVASLLAYADELCSYLGTGWCALDILQEGEGWRTLETSLAWPWKVTEHSATPIFRTPYRWHQLWDAMFHEVAEGHLPSTSPAT